MAKAVLRETERVGLARLLLLNQAGARVRACTGAVRLVLVWFGAGAGADRFESRQAARETMGVASSSDHHRRRTQTSANGKGRGVRQSTRRMWTDCTRRLPCETCEKAPHRRCYHSTTTAHSTALHHALQITLSPPSVTPMPMPLSKPPCARPSRRTGMTHGHRGILLLPCRRPPVCRCRLSQRGRSKYHVFLSCTP